MYNSMSLTGCLWVALRKSNAKKEQVEMARKRQAMDPLAKSAKGGVVRRRYIPMVGTSSEKSMTID
jgi:hypothetical protein